MWMTKDKSFYQAFFKLTLALVLQQVVVLSVNLADNVMLGNYSETALSGVAAVNQIQFILQQLVYEISNGMVVLASQYWGQAKKEPVRRLMSIAFWLAVGIAGILFVIVSAVPHAAVGIFTKDETIVRVGVSYLSIVRFSYLFFAVTTVFLGGMRVAEKVKIALYVSVIALVINCSINFVLIKGRFGFPEMGARGAAVGTLIARIAECMIVAGCVLHKDKVLCLRLKDLLKFDRILAGDYLRVSSPLIVCGFLWGCNNALQTAVLGHMSSNAIAAYSISATVFLFLKVVSVGASSAAAVLMGRAVGSGSLHKVKEYTRTFQVLFLGIGMSLGLFLFAIRGPFLSLYNLSPYTRSLAEKFILIEVTVLAAVSYHKCMNSGVICGGGDTRFGMIIDMIFTWGVAIPLAFGCAFYWKVSPVIVMLALNFDQYLKCISAALYGNSYRWVHNLTR